MCITDLRAFVQHGQRDLVHSSRYAVQPAQRFELKIVEVGVGSAFVREVSCNEGDEFIWETVASQVNL